MVEQHPAVPVLDGTGTEVALPVRCHGDLAGVLVVAGPAPAAPADLREARRAAVRLGEVLTALGPGGGAPRDVAARRLLRHAAALAGVEDAERIGPAVLRAALDVAPLRSALLATSTRDGSLEPRWSAGPLGEGLTEAAGPATLDALRETVVHAGSAALALGRPGSEVPDPLAPLHAGGARTLVVVALRHGGALTGLLLLADAGAPAPAGADAELLELLGAHGAASLQAAATATALRHRAETDPLTGLGHHATFHAALAGAHRRPLTAVVLVRPRRLQGAQRQPRARHGDARLRAVARALQGALRRGDRLFRIGGDEFAALVAVERPGRAPPATACAPPSPRRPGRHRVGGRRPPERPASPTRAPPARRPRPVPRQGPRARRGRPGGGRDHPAEGGRALPTRGRASRPSWTRRTSATSRSSPTSTTASRRWPTASSR